MEVLSVDLPKRLLSSSSQLQQEIACKIQATHNLTISLQDGSEQLLSLYEFHQEHPFGDPTFDIQITPFPGLPLPTLSPSEWLDLSDAERLQDNMAAFSNLAVYLTAVEHQQREVNPDVEVLHNQLQNARLQCLGVVSNLKTIMKLMCIALGPITPAKPPKPDSAFLMKIFGYKICHLYRDWVNRCEKDMAFLLTK